MTAPDDPSGDSSRPTTRRRVLAGLGSAAAAGIAGCGGLLDGETTTETQTFAAADLSTLRVEDATDSVTVTGTDGDQVGVTAEKSAFGQTDPGDLEMHHEIEGETLTLTTEKPNVVGVGGGGIGLDVDVPEAVAVEAVSSEDGSVTVAETAGDLSVRTDDGSVTVEGIDGDVDVHSVDGSVTAEGIDGDADLHCEDGSVTARGVGGFVDVRAQVGSVEVFDSGGIAGIIAEDGSVTADVLAIRGQTRIESGDGSVTVALGDDLAADVEAVAEDGSLTGASALDDVTTATDDHLSGSVGDGGETLTVRAADGSVTLTRDG